MKKKTKQAILDSIKHWKRMRKWVRKQPSTNKVKLATMDEVLKENWKGDYCPLCDLFFEEFIEEPCKKCPLAISGNNCNDDNSIWRKVAEAKTWGEWYEASGKMIEALMKCLEEL